MSGFSSKIRGISLDFANTLYPLNASETRETVGYLHRFLEQRLGKKLPRETLCDLYFEIRDRQFADNKITLRDNDFPSRLREMIARVDETPNDELIQEASDSYAHGFIQTMRLPSPHILETIRHLADHFKGNIAVCSNFIRADCIIEPLRRDGVLPLLKGVIVSCDVGFVKPHPLVFATVANCLGLDPSEIAHVGDDLDADIIGGKRAGFTTVYTSELCPTAEPEAIRRANADFSLSRFVDMRLLCT